MTTISAQCTSTTRDRRFTLRQWLVSGACRALLAAACFIFGALYVGQTSAISARGYDLASLERSVEHLKRENQRLSFEIAKYQSMSSIKDRIAAMDLVSVGDIRYAETADAIVARR
jgi:hypothetical protein